ncbi:MAG: NADH-quinone oxidoreductase subunit N [Candidatus Midichloria sp.]|nr:MAG: NADH-quinone oxidoreductase subunit N [Candidatus Midichloria sp.]
MMLETVFEDLAVLIPELTIAFAAIVSLIFGSYFKKASQYIFIPISISSLVAIYFAITGYGQDLGAFNDSVLYNSYTISMKVIILVAFLIALLSLSIIKPKESAIPFEIPVLLSLSVIGMLIMVCANDLLIIYLGLELMNLPLYVLTTFSQKHSKSHEAGLKFFMLGALSSCLYLFGSSIMYGFVASTNFNIIGGYHISVMNSNEIEVAVPIALLIALVLILSAFFFKVSSAPFHMWVPDVYQGAPTFITMFLSAAPKIASVSVLLNILYMPFIDLIDQWQQVIVFCAIASLFIGSLGGIMQKKLKRMLAYSTIGHIGFILMAISVGELSGIIGAISYITIYVAMSFLTFLPILSLETDDKYNGKIKEISGLAKAHPLLSVIILIAMLSMAGIPPFAGFFAKFYVLFSVIEQGLYSLAIIGVLATVVSCYYYLRIIKVMYFDHANNSFTINIPFSVKFIILVVALFNVGYVMVPEPILAMAKQAAESLISI